MNQRNPQNRSRALLAVGLTTVLLVSTVAPWAPIAGAATDGTEPFLLIHDPAPGAVSDHEWAIQSDTSQTLTTIELNYSGTGTNLSGVSDQNIRLIINDAESSTKVAPDSVSIESDDEVAVIDLSGTPPSISAGDYVSIEILDAVVNPADENTYDASVALQNEASTFAGGSTTFEIAPTGSVSGQITDAADDSPIEGAYVELKLGSDTVTFAGTDGNGEFQLVAPAGTYMLQATCGESTNATEVEIEVGTPKTENLSLATGGGCFEPTQTGTVYGTVLNASDDSPVEGATVELGDDTGVVDTTVTDGSGNYALEAPEGTYDIWTEHETYSFTAQEVKLSAEGPKTVDFDLDPAGETANVTVSGIVTSSDDQSAVEGATVTLFESDDRVLSERNTTTTDASGAYTLEAPPGSYDLRVTHENFSDADRRVTLLDEHPTDGNVKLAPLQWEIVSTSIEHVNGTEPTQNPEIRTYETNLLGVSLVNESGDQELADLGVENDTEFQVTIEAKNISPRLLIGTVHNASWTYEDIGDNTTRIVINGTPGSAQYRFDAPDLDHWNENDTADMEYEQMWDIAIGEMDAPREQKPQEVDGMILATDAQSFSLPHYDPATETLSLTVGGPHFTVDGDVNDGYFEAFLPQSLLDSWEISSPGELTGAYQGSEEAISVAAVDGGYQVDMDIHYSAGEVAIASSGAAAPENFDVTIDSTNAPVAEGETLDVTATVENTGGESGTQTIALDVDGETVDSSTATLAGGDSTQVTLSWSPGSGAAGSHTVTVGSDDTSDSTTVTVEESDDSGAESGDSGSNGADESDESDEDPADPAAFAVAITDAPSSVDVGDTLEIAVAVSNEGDSSGEQEITVVIGDRTIDSATVSLDAGADRVVTLTYEVDEGDEGDHTVTAASSDASDSVSLTVEPSSTSDPDEGDDEAEAESDEVESDPSGDEGEPDEADPETESDGSAGDEAGDSEPAPGAESPDDETPGFGFGVAVVALLALAVRNRLN